MASAGAVPLSDLPGRAPGKLPGTVAPDSKIVKRRRRTKVPLDQRKRVRLACEWCRRIKVRCDGQEPCTRCAGSSKECRYTEMPASPATLSPSVIAGAGGESRKLALLEQLFAKLHPDLPTDVDALESYHASLPSDPTMSSTAEPLSRDGEDDGSVDRNNDDDTGSREANLSETEHPETQHLVLDRSPMPTASMTVVNQGKTHFEGPFSYWTFFHAVRQVVTDGDTYAGEEEEEEEEAGRHGDDAMPDEDNHGSYDGATATATHPSVAVGGGGGCPADWRTATLAALPPRDVVDFLVTTFFRSAQANHFYIHPEIFSRKLHAFYHGTHEFAVQRRKSAADARRSVEFISLLFMVFAIGSQFAELETGEPRDAPSPDPGGDAPLDWARLTVPEPSSSSSSSAPPPGWRFYEVSRRLLADVICSSSMASVQVCVLQGIFLPSTKNSRDAGYNLLGLALRMAINMGLHRACGTASSSLHPHVRELRNRLWWSVYVAERLFSVEMGRPLSISDAEIDAPFPVAMPAWDFVGGGATTNVDNLVAMARLCRLMGKIVETVYCQASAGSNNNNSSDSNRNTSAAAAVIRPHVFRQLKRELDQSRSELPASLRLGRLPSRPVAHIALTYEQATILLTRSCLHYATAETTTASRDHHGGGGRRLGDEAMQFLRQQSRDCIKAAVASIHILASLRARSLLCRFSFHDALYCTAALYVLLMGQKLDGATAPSQPLSQGIRVLLDLARGSAAAAGALRYILRALQRSPASSSWFSSANRPPGLGDETSAQEADGAEERYERGRRAWKAWLTHAQPHAEATATGPARKDPAGPPAQPDRAVGNRVVGNAWTPASGWAPMFHADNAGLPNHHVVDDVVDAPDHVVGLGFTAVDSDGSDGAADMPDLQPFWIHENPDLNLDPLSRDLSGLADLLDFDDVNM